MNSTKVDASRRLENNSVFDGVQSKRTTLPPTFYAQPHLISRHSAVSGHADDRQRRRSRVRASFMEFEEHVPQGFRARVIYGLESQHFETLVASMILLSLLCMVYETNTKVQCGEQSTSPDCGVSWVTGANIFFTVAFTTECTLRIFAYRWHFFFSRWNCFDILLVAISFVDLIASELTTSGNVLRSFRILRLLRVSRILSFFPEMYLMLRGFVGTFKTMFWGMVLITGFLFVWSVLTVEVIGPLEGIDYRENTWCAESFSSVQMCMLMFFQTVFAVDSWGACATPIIKKEWWSIVIFGGALITMQLGLTNLLLSVIMERATAAQMQDAERKHEIELELRRERIEHLHQVMREELDRDDSGSLSMEELEEGLRDNSTLATLLQQLNIRHDDLQEMVDLLQDEDGNASIDDLVASVFRCGDEDLPRQILLVGLQIFNLRRSVENSAAMIEKGSQPNNGLMPLPRINIGVLGNTSGTTPYYEGDNKERFLKSLEELQNSLNDGLQSLGDHVLEQRRMLSEHVETIQPKLSELETFSAAIATSSSAMSAASAAARFRAAANEAKAAAAAATAPPSRKPPKFLPGPLMRTATKGDLSVAGPESAGPAAGQDASAAPKAKGPDIGGRPADLDWKAAANKMKSLKRTIAAANWKDRRGSERTVVTVATGRESE